MSKPIEILLVEDNPGDQRLVGEALKTTDSNLHIAGDGASALEFLRTSQVPGVTRPQLIILDLNLPRKSGREVLKEIKQDMNLRRIPVIVFSSSAAETDVAACYDLHANCYITKPTDLEGYFRVLAHVVQFWLGVAQLSHVENRPIEETFWPERPITARVL